MQCCGNMWCVYWVLCSVRLHTLHGTHYTHHNLKHMLPQHCITYNDVFLLIISIKVAALLFRRSRDRFQVVSLGIFFRSSFRQNHVPWGRLSLRKRLPRISPGVKATGAFSWRPTTLVVLNVEIIRGLNLPGTPRATSACRGIPLFFCFYKSVTLARLSVSSLMMAQMDRNM